MGIKSPQIPKELSLIDFASLTLEDPEEITVSTAKISSEKIESGDLNKIEVRTSLFEGCIFRSCSFEGAGFVDIVFESCDFSNSRFTGAYLERCRFINCKCVGINMRDTVIKHTSFENTNLRYSCLDKAKISEVFFGHTDFTEASMSEAVLKKFEAKESRFIKNNFFKTMLAGIDFSENEFASPTVSSSSDELKGAVINPIQAVDLISLWGVIVK
jgi:Uncharacterized low-complexity proteins